MYDFGSLCESFGILYDRERAIRLGTRQTAKCCMMSGEWLGWNAEAECTTFLKLDQEWSEEFSEKWTLCERTYSESKTKGVLTGSTAGKTESATEVSPEAPIMTKAATRAALLMVAEEIETGGCMQR